MRKLVSFIVSLFALVAWAADGNVQVVDLGEGHALVRINPTQKYLILPVEDDAPAVNISVIVDNQQVESFTVCLAINKVDYTVPYDLSNYAGKHVVLRFAMSPLERGAARPQVKESAFSSRLALSNTFDASNREKKWRPEYHFTPQWGWMNDPNGMVYENGEYHLFFQYNPYGSRWGNMNWGHAVTRDLVEWEHLPVAIAPDGLGTIFSGSAVVDKNNTAGFGAGAIVAFYTQASARQMQSIAYSTDHGRTFKKYAGNPVLTGEVADFRDPKVSWHEATKKWIMALAVGQEIRFYSSPNLKDWTYESNFGEGQGNHGGVWECPDLFELPVQGTNQKKWVLVVNINPGGPFGGSATQYFVGTFDGHKFVNESPKATKWMDYGKDHYATVTWSNAPDNRVIALAWMSNWQYANQVPTIQFRSANSVARDLGLFMYQGDTYLSVIPSKENLALRDDVVKQPTELCEIVVDLRKNTEITLSNDKGEALWMSYDAAKQQFVMDRRQSGEVAFSLDFPGETFAPTYGNIKQLRIFIDRCSVEVFDAEGKMAMSNLVFPSEPYNQLVVKGGKAKIYEIDD